VDEGKIPWWNESYDTKNITPIKYNWVIVGWIDAYPFRWSNDTLYISNIRITPEAQGKWLWAKAIYDLLKSKPEFTKIRWSATSEARSFWKKVWAKFSSDESTGFTLDKNDFLSYFNAKWKWQTLAWPTGKWIPKKK
jgi:hypothetical protein